MPEISLYICFSKPCKAWILTRDLISPPSCQLQFPLMFSFPFLSCFFPLFIPSLFYSSYSFRLCLHAPCCGQRRGRRKPVFSPSGPCFDFPKLWGGSSCLPAEGSALGAVSVVGTSRPASAPTGEGWARVVVALLSRWSVQL